MIAPGAVVGGRVIEEVVGHGVTRACGGQVVGDGLSGDGGLHTAADQLPGFAPAQMIQQHLDPRLVGRIGKRLVIVREFAVELADLFEHILDLRDSHCESLRENERLRSMQR